MVTQFAIALDIHLISAVEMYSEEGAGFIGAFVCIVICWVYKSFNQPHCVFVYVTIYQVLFIVSISQFNQ